MSNDVDQDVGGRKTYHCPNGHTWTVRENGAWKDDE